MRLTIGKKLIGGFLMVSILLGIVSAVSIYYFYKIDKSYDDLISRREIILSNSKDIRSDTLQQMSSLRDYLLTQSEEGLERYNQANSNQAAVIDSTLGLVKREEDANNLQRLAALSEQFKTKSDEVFALIKTDKAAAVKLAASDVIPIGREMESLSKQIVDGQRTLVDTISKDTSVMADSVSQTVLILSVIAFVCAILIGLVASIHISRPVVRLANLAKRIAAGDLNSEAVKVKNRDEVGELAHSFNDMSANLRHLIFQIGTSAQQVAASSEELTASAEQTNKATEQINFAVQEVAAGTDNQVNSVTEGTQSVNELSIGAQQIADNAQSVSYLAAEAVDKSLSGSNAILTAVEQMNSIQETMNGLSSVIKGLGQHTEHIGQIVQFITDIASQTNLLALNASIEASRAGEHGRGFAVVASEIRKLAEQSTRSSHQITEYISTIQQETMTAVRSMESGTGEVAEGIRVVHVAGASFAEIQQAVQQVAAQIQDVAASAQQMSSSTEQVVDSMNYISGVAQETASGMKDVSAVTEEQFASMEEITASAASLSRMAEQLQETIGRFKV